MDDDWAGEAAVAAGAVAGIAGLGVFLLAHHLWIVPVWFIAPVGVVMAGAGGAAVGASYATLRPHLPRRPSARATTSRSSAAHRPSARSSPSWVPSSWPPQWSSWRQRHGSPLARGDG